MRLEREVIEEKFDIIDRNVKFLKQMKALTPEQFVESYRDAQTAK